ncbi:MAG TPA: hypothetical protein VGW98_03080 [Solirubrobacteraceae bacterium]|nr:hypothetical protein [Solirubrobacteraceae bacterium]
MASSGPPLRGGKAAVRDQVAETALGRWRSSPRHDLNGAGPEP